MKIKDKRHVMVTLDTTAVSSLTNFRIDGKPTSDFPPEKAWSGSGVVSVALPIGVHTFSGAAIKQITVNGQDMIPSVYVTQTTTDVLITDNTVITFADED